MNIDFNSMVNGVANHKDSELETIFNFKRTENGDFTHKSTGNHLLNLIFGAEYYNNHLSEVKIGTSDIEKLFSMFMRDPRFGMKYRDLGRVLMYKSGLSPEAVAFCGRFDDLWKSPMGKKVKDEWINYLFEQCKNGNELAKKWMPHYVGKNNGHIAKSTIMASKMRKMLGLNKQQYNKFVKCHTVESDLSQHNQQAIEFDKIPSLALIKYWSRFAGTNKSHKTDLAEKFNAYLESVRKGEKKMNFSTATVYDIYRNRTKIDADLAFAQIKKISGSWIPVVDTSASMYWTESNDAAGKALSIGHYLAKTSTYCKDQFIAFSSRPRLMELKGDNYLSEIKSMYTGDCSSTNFGAVMNMLGNLSSEFPEYIVVLSDMEFNSRSYGYNQNTIREWREKGVNTKLVWWNLNSRNMTSPQAVRTDDYGSVFISGYDPTMLKYLESGFNGEEFLAKLLTEYAKNIPDDMKI